MNNALHRWMVSAAQGGVTSSPLIRAARIHGANVLIPVYAGAAVLSLIILAAFAPESAGGAAVQRVVVTVIWIGVAGLFVFTGTPLAHQLFTWGVCLTGSFVAFFAALSDFAAASILGNAYAALGLFDLVICAGFAAATIVAARTMAQLGAAGAGSPAATLPQEAMGFPVAPAMPAPTAANPGTDTVESAVLHRDAPAPSEEISGTEPPMAGPPLTPTPDPSNPAAVHQYRAFGNAVPRQNALATPALVLGVLIPPVGVVLGHVSLSQIKRSGEEGRSLATAGLVIGYVFTGLALASWIAIIAFTASLSNSIDKSFDQVSTPTTTNDYPTTTTDTATVDSSASSITGVIRTASVGTCVHKESSGTTITELYTTGCSSYDANYQVSARVSDTDSCSSYSSWVSTTASDSTSDLVVLCLTSE